MEFGIGTPRSRAPTFLRRRMQKRACYVHRIRDRMQRCLLKCGQPVVNYVKRWFPDGSLRVLNFPPFFRGENRVPVVQILTNYLGRQKTREFSIYLFTRTNLFKFRFDSKQEEFDDDNGVTFDFYRKIAWKICGKRGEETREKRRFGRNDARSIKKLARDSRPRAIHRS